MDEASGSALQLDDLATQLQQLTQVVSHLHTQQQATMAAIPPPRCPVNPPEKFGGNVEEFPVFLAQCELYIELQDWEFPNDKTKNLVTLCLCIDGHLEQYAHASPPKRKLLLHPQPVSLLQTGRALLSWVFCKTTATGEPASTSKRPAPCLTGPIGLGN
ncbi:UNVERIFIED_CONTAM: hypothetical protein K2H54_002744 [Gekko kuhli]